MHLHHKKVFIENLKIIENQRILISQKDILHYLKNVIRIKENDEFFIQNGKGLILKVTVDEIKKDGILAKIIQEQKVGDKRLLSLAVGVIKRMDELVSYASELGIKEIFPLLTEYTQIKPSLSRIERWQRIAKAAAKDKAFFCKIYHPTTLQDLLKEKNNKNIFLLSPPLEGSLYISPLPKREVLLLIGPEGGFSKNELRMAKDMGVKIISIGEDVYKTLTCAIIAIIIFSFKLKIL